MRRPTRRWTVLALAAMVLAGPSGCSQVERRTHDTWQGLIGQPRQPARGLDINSATRDELASLPGLSDADAERIIDHRPYADRDGLLLKRVLGHKKFRRIRDYVYVGRT
jgi:hypothetical protein